MKCLVKEENKIITYYFNKTLELFGYKFILKDNKLYLFEVNEKNLLSLNCWHKFEDLNFIVLSNYYYTYQFMDKLLISKIGDIIINTNITIENNILTTYDNYPIYINYKLLDANQVLLNDGDVIIISDIIFTYHYNRIVVWGEEKNNINLELINKSTYINPEYEKSPRIFYRFKEEEIELLNPPGREKISKNTIIKIIVPPLISILTTGLMAYFTRRAFFVIIAGITTICSLTFSITSFFQKKKQIRKDNEKRQEKYQNYLLDQRKELFDLYNNEKLIYEYNSPSIKSIDKMISNYSSRIFERDIFDNDFLEISMGYTDLDSHYKLKFKDNVLDLNDDNLIDEAKEIYNKYNTIDNVKFSINLNDNHVGLIGNKNLVIDEIKRIILELCFFHSYYDINLILLYDNKYKNEFDFVNWLKHFSLIDINLSTNIYNNKIKEQVLSSLYQILKQRKLQNKIANSYKPHYIMYVDDISLIANHPIMEYLQDGVELGITLIVRVDQFRDLPSNIKTVFLLKDKYNIDVLMIDGEKSDMVLHRDLVDDIDFDKCSRNLSVLDLQLGISNSIPEVVTFLDMYQVKEPNQLGIYDRWQKSNVYQSMSVPLGLRGENDIVYLNLHEKAHGPHGLVAGTTGSGKSELIQSYILSLAVNFSPYDVGFLLIDFKGGGMANLFKDLPHLIGTITNLDGAESMRALASIKSELKRRQQIFNDHDVNNINLYTKLFKQNPDLEPLPHLFIISDEFAELKKEQPEFMDELVSVARIGRTLGVHLILATQKPTGVVNDQIWSNSKFKLALKVQDESDSKEILKTSDAAHITKTGRAYLQVGNNEIYELFQSAFSGANYDTNIEENKEEIDKRVYLINELGQKQLLNDDYSEDDNKDNMVTQLDVVIKEINEEYNKHHYKEVRKAWLPSLPKKLINPNINKFKIKDLSEIKEINLNVDLGLVDIPEKQQQKEYSINLVKKPNLVVYGAGGYGKSLTLINAIMDLAIKNNPEILEFYIIDLGNSGLIGLSPLVHVADYISLNTVDKVNKVVNRINKIVEQRKLLLTINSSQNINVLEENLDELYKRIVIVIDNFDVAKELGDEFINFVDKLAQEGPSLGIYLMISASRALAIKTSTSNNLNNKICLYLHDNGDINSIVGKSKYPLSDNLKGRGLINVDGVNQIQIYTSFDPKPLSSYNKKMKNFINDINTNYTGNIPKPIPQLPDEFTSDMLCEYDYQEDDITTNIMGLSISDVMQVGISSYPPILIVCGHRQSGKSNMIKLLISQVKEKVYAIDSKNKGLLKIKNLDNVMYCDCSEDVNKMIKNINTIVKRRKEDCFKLLTEGEIDSMTQYYDSLEEKIVFIDDINDLVKNYGKLTSFSKLITEANECGIKFVIGLDATASICPLDSDLARIIKITTNQIIVGKLSTYNPLALGNKVFPKTGFGIVAIEGDMRRIKIPLYI